MAATMKPMLTQVLEDLAACKGGWMEIVRDLEPDNAVSFYSWLTKLAQGVIKEPSVNRIQRLYDYFRAKGHGDDAPQSKPRPLPTSGQGANPGCQTDDQESTAAQVAIAEQLPGGAKRTGADECGLTEGSSCV